MLGSASVIGLCVSNTLCVRLLGVPSIGLYGLGLAIVCAALWCCIVSGVRRAFSRARFAAFEFIVACVAAGLVASLVFPVGPALDWRLDAGPDAGLPVTLATRHAWGASGRAFELHADQPGAAEATWPSRAVAPLRRAFKGIDLRVQIRLTQPEWVVLGDDGQADPAESGADGFDVLFQARRGEVWRTLLTRRFDFFASDSDRVWHTVVLDLNHDDEEIAVEVLPGGPDANNWYDRVWFSTLRATARFRGLDASRIAVVTDTVTLAAVGLTLLVFLAWGVPARGIAVRHTPPVGASAQRPLSERVCDASVWILALWTVCCHATVIAGGGLLHLLAGFAVAAGLLVAGRLWLGRGVTLERSSEPAAQRATPACDRLEFAGVLRMVTSLLAAIVVVIFLANEQFVAFWWGCVLLLLRGLAYLLIEAPQPPPSPAPVGGRGRHGALWALALACASIALVFHHQGLDDSFYVNVAVAAADAPRLPLMSGDTMHGVDGLAMHMPAHRLHSFELLNGGVSYLLGAPAIYVFHWGAAGAIALLAPLALGYLLRRLTPTYWLAATAAVLVVLIGGGERLHWYGNELISHTWYGKSAYLFALLPLAYAYGLDFGSRPTALGWLRLAAVQIAAVGCTSSALWSVPIACCLAAAAAVRLSWRAPLTLAATALASVYVIALGLYLKPQMSGVAAAVPVVLDAGMLLSTATDTILGGGLQRLVAFAALLVVPLVLVRGLARRFAMLVPLVILLLILSPYTESVVSRNLTGPSYWRAFWSLPLPLLMGLAATAPLQFGASRAARLACGALTVLLLAAFVRLVPTQNTFNNQGGVWAAVPELNVPKDKFAWAQRVNESVEPGAVVLAPQAISAWIPTMHHHAYPLVIREIYLRRLAVEFGPLDAEWRLLMTEAVSDRQDLEPRHRAEPGVRRRRSLWLAPLLFRLGLDYYNVSAVCINRGVDRYPLLREVLQHAGFEPRIADATYELWQRPPLAAHHPATESMHARHE